ncbi:Riboflavin kinase domain [Bartonella apihabitans]|uniref:bifunctional riboflavin kinase/FAD synthetase n=1 Tax=Bartonella apihabitans TaxID=2750929 RepID=UPI003997A2C5
MTNKFLRLKNLAALPESHRNSVVAIGNFDGVHRGHQAVLEKALDIARSTGRPAIVYTFEPHPKSFFKPEKPVDRLTPAAEKARILELMGFDGVVEQHFDAKFAHLTAEEFVKHILCENFHASAVVTGSDFHFGSKRVGTPDYLADCGKKLGFAVVKVPPFCDENGQVISSSRIRALLADGKVEEAAGLLGYHYTLCSKVIHGAKLGRTLGFPTANMALPEETGLAFGIYAIRFRRSDGTLFDGVASFGKRPTVEGDGVPLLESFLFSFDGNLYDETASVSFYSYLRGEQKFDGLQPLIAQMNKDKEEAEAALTAASPLSALDRNFTFTNR